MMAPLLFAAATALATAPAAACAIVLPADLPPRDASLPSGVELFRDVCLASHPTDASAVTAAMGGETQAFPADVPRSPHTVAVGEDAVTILRGPSDAKTLDDLIVQFGTGESVGAEVRHCSVLALGSTMAEALDTLAPVLRAGTLVLAQEPEPFEIVPRANLAWIVDALPGYGGIALLSLRGDVADPRCLPVHLSIEAADGLDITLGLLTDALDPTRIREREVFRRALERVESAPDSPPDSTIDSSPAGPSKTPSTRSAPDNEEAAP